MSKKPESAPKSVSEDEDVGNVAQTPLVIHRQYLKDMSFESPNAPQILVPSKNPPEMDMNILLDVQKLKNPESDSFYEFIEVPQMMFPFARQIISFATQTGGFSPLNLAPVDFRSMYITRFAEAKAEA